MSTPGGVRAHVWVSGRVQGVFFRQETARVARAHEVAGWVRNLPDGRVEAVFEGSPAAVEAVVEWVRHGPPLAIVGEVEVTGERPEGYDGFRIR